MAKSFIQSLADVRNRVSAGIGNAADQAYKVEQGAKNYLFAPHGYQQADQTASRFLNQHVVQPVSQGINRGLQNIDTNLNAGVDRIGNDMRVAAPMIQRQIAPPGFKGASIGSDLRPVAHTVRGIGQDFVRAPLAGIISSPYARQDTFTPTTSLEKTLLGTKPIQSIQSNPAHQFFVKHGASPQMATLGAGALLAGSIGSNFTGEGKAVEEGLPIAERLAKSIKPTETLNLLSTLSNFRALAPANRRTLVKAVTKEDNPTQVQRILNYTLQNVKVPARDKTLPSISGLGQLSDSTHDDLMGINQQLGSYIDKARVGGGVTRENKIVSAPSPEEESNVKAILRLMGVQLQPNQPLDQAAEEAMLRVQQAAAKRRSIIKPQQAFGAVGGIQPETDQNGQPTGRLKFNPAGAALGIAGTTAAGKFAPSADVLAQEEKIMGKAPASGLGKIGKAAQPLLSAHPLDIVRNKLDQLYTQAIDRFHPLTKLGKQAGDEQAVQNALTAHYGAGSTADYHVNHELAPILKSTNPDDLRAYTVAQRDLELAKRGIQGSDAGAANQVLQGLQQKYGDLSPLQNAAGGLYKYQNDLVKKYLVDTGVISQDAYKAMRDKNQAYVPFKRIMDTVDGHLGVVPGNKNVGSVSSQDIIKGIKGSNRQIVDPLQSIIQNTYKIVGLGRRQQVAKTLVGLKDKLPEGIITKLTGDAGLKPVVSVLENGKAQKYVVPPDVAQAAKGMNEDQLSTIVKILQAPTKVFRETATGVNPEFFAPNITRDLQSAFVNAKVNPLDYVKGLAHYLKKDDMYQQFLKSGGQTSRLSLDNASIQKTLGQVTSPRGLKVTKPSDIYRLLQEAGQASEQPTRIAAFERTLKSGLAKGLSPEEAHIQAAQMAQEATTNFARRGSATKSVNAIYAFINARAQGVDQLVRTAKKDPKGFAFRMGLVSQAPALALYAYNRQYPSYFDDRIVSPTDKQNNFIFMLPGGQRYLKIPKGDIGKLANPTEAFLSHLDGHGGSINQELGQSLKAFSPISNAGDLIPTALRPIAENAANKNFFTGQQIVPDYKKNFPPSKQDKNSTAPIYRGIGKVINQSPARIQNFVQGYGTGFARIGEMATTPLSPAEFKKPQNQQGDQINNVPIVRRFIGGAHQTADEAALSQAKKVKSAQFNINDIKAGIKRGDLTPEEGMNQINQLMQIQGKLPANGVQAADSRLNKPQFATSSDAPKNALQTAELYGKGLIVDPKNTLEAALTKERLRKVTGNSAIFERQTNANQGNAGQVVDHAIPLSIGGSNNSNNLVVQNPQQAAAKDVVEKQLYKQLQAGKITKTQAQQQMKDWVSKNSTSTAQSPLVNKPIPADVKQYLQVFGLANKDSFSVYKKLATDTTIPESVKQKIVTGLGINVDQASKRYDLEGQKAQVNADYSLSTDQAKRQKDLNGWMAAASTKHDYLTQYLGTLDPNKDKLEYTKTKNALGDLEDQASKYKSYGGFTKGSSKVSQAIRTNTAQFNLQADQLKRSHDTQGYVGLLNQQINAIEGYKKTAKNKAELINYQNKQADLADQIQRIQHSVAKQGITDQQAQFNLQADQLKRGNDPQGYLAVLGQHYNLLEDSKKLATSEAEKTNLANKQADLVAEAQKIRKNAGFTAPKRVKVPRTPRPKIKRPSRRAKRAVIRKATLSLSKIKSKR